MWATCRERRRPQLSVLIVDDDERIREALRDVINAQPDMTVVALAADRDEAVALAVRQHPDVAIVDVRMPGGGAETAREVVVRLFRFLR